MPPRVIAGRYRVERAVGRGGMGTVWLCQDDVLHRDVAVKQIGVLPGESAADARRAMREARTAAALNHRNAVSIFDVVEHEGTPWLVMEYVPSRTLAELMDRGRLPATRVAWIGAQVAAALASAHALGIIHRDVKPGNILVGDDDLAKISDFGIARIAHDEQLTLTGLMTGTPGYFSPELARGAEPGPQDDVWALGATLYAAVEGRPAYPKRANPLATLQAIASEEVEHPRRAKFLLDPIGHMMDRDPKSRWTMARAETSLRDLAEHPKTAAKKPVAKPAAKPAARPAGKPPTKPPAKSQKARETRRETAVLPVAQAKPQTQPQPQPQPQREPPREPRRSRALLVALGLAALLLLGVGGYLLSTNLGTDDPSGTDRDSATPSPTPTPTPTPTQSPVETVESYFDTVPSDLDTGWSKLSPGMQRSVGRDSYDSFWAGIEAVDVANVQPVGNNAVRALVTYTRTDGSTSSETQVLTLVPDGSGYLIDSDR